MKQTSLAALIIIFSIAGIVLMNSVYILDETEQAVITQFGEPIGDPIQKPGLHLKLPVVHTIHRFDKRILNWDGYPSEVPTSDKKFIWVDVTGRWRISEPLTFLQTMHNERNAQSRLDDIMDGITRNYITRYRLPDVVRSTNRILELQHSDEEQQMLVDRQQALVDTEFDPINVGRDEITRKILENAKQVLTEYGIELIDIRIKRINYIQSVQRKVFERMITERQRAAEQLRSEGLGVRAEIEGQKEKELKRITSEAYREAQKLRGKADAEATRIYGEAYSKDASFYAFLQTLEKYPQSLRDGRLVLSTDSDFLKYLKRAE